MPSEKTWTRQERNMTTVENNLKPPTVPFKGILYQPQSVNTKPRQQRPLRAYQDLRKKFIIDKLFSPVLQSYAS